jgi:ankyrin repeat protein
MHYACFAGSIDILDLLIKAGGDIRAVSNKGVNCLHLACQRNRLDMVKHLINVFGFSPEQETPVTKKRPIHIAAFNGALEVMKFLVGETKVNVNAIDNNNDDALLIAIKRSQDQTAEYLLSLISPW